MEEALQNLSTARDVCIELRPCDRTEDLMVAQFATKGCGCRRKCLAQFTADAMYELIVTNCRFELVIVLLGQLMASNNGSDTLSPGE